MAKRSKYDEYMYGKARTEIRFDENGHRELVHDNEDEDDDE